MTDAVPEAVAGPGPDGVADPVTGGVPGAGSTGSTGNALLDAVLAVHPSGPGAGLAAWLEPVHVALGEVVHEPGEPVRHVVFPRSAVLGLLTVTPGTPDVEAMAVGSDGVVGLAAVLGDGTSPHRVVCQVPGQVLRVPLDVLRELADAERPVRQLLGRQAQGAILLLSQRVACTQQHTAEQRVADWLLRQADRVGRRPVPVTQQLLARMLGLRRTTVSAIAAQLQRTHLISYRYGHVTIDDDRALRRLACSCYQVFRDETDRLAAARRTTVRPGRR